MIDLSEGVVWACDVICKGSITLHCIEVTLPRCTALLVWGHGNQWTLVWLNVFPMHMYSLEYRYQANSVCFSGESLLSKLIFLFTVSPFTHSVHLSCVAQYAANQTRIIRQTPSLFDKCTRFFYERYTTHGTNGFTSLSKDEASWLSVLL